MWIASSLWPLFKRGRERGLVRIELLRTSDYTDIVLVNKLDRPIREIWIYIECLEKVSYRGNQLHNNRIESVRSQTNLSLLGRIPNQDWHESYIQQFLGARQWLNYTIITSEADYSGSAWFSPEIPPPATTAEKR